MSKITTRGSAPGQGRPVEHRLAQLLDTPFLARVVPHLPPETLHQVIRYRGLEACGDLITSATPAQLTALLDLDLWHHPQAGRDDQFDVDRFGDWVEMLVEIESSVAARTVGVLDKNLVVAGVSRYVRVFDPGIFEPVAQSDDEPGHDSRGGSLECEVGGYIVRARRADAWDAIVTLLLALDAEHSSDFQAVMQGCRRVSNSRPEADGLDDMLQAPEQHLHDVTIERERRRSQQGYATPADARAFLQMARQPKHTRSEVTTGTITVNPIVTAYFRAADEALESSPSSSVASRSTDLQVDAHDVPETLDAVMELLTEAGLMPERPRALLAGATADPQAARLSRLRQLMEYVHDTDDTAYFTRSRELAFLANTLLAGCSVQSRPFTPQEASDAAASICNLGLECQPAPDAFLIDHDLVTVFEAGWSVLHQDVSVFVAQQLLSTVDDLRCVDRDIQRELIVLRRTLARHLDAGTPWLARGAADVLARLDVTAWTIVVGLLDECPILPAALTAVLDGRTTTVSPTAFDFISTAAQIVDVRTFMRKLPGVLRD